MQSFLSLRRRRGFTLVELMMAMLLTLIIIFALAQAFANIGQSVSQGRAAIEMSGRVRGASHRFESDIKGLTLSVRPQTTGSSEGGYFEYLEGWGRDDKPLPAQANRAGGVLVIPSTFGDIDDVVAFTSRSSSEPFSGVAYVTPASGGLVSTVVEAQTAEIIWFTRFDDRDGDGIPGAGEVTLYRRALLIRPEWSINTAYWANQAATLLGPGLAAHPAAALFAFQRENDISARWDPQTSTIIANTLEDLTKRENRFAHVPLLLTAGSTAPGNFPHWLVRGLLSPRGTRLLPGPDGAFGWANLNDDGLGQNGNLVVVGGTGDNWTELGAIGSDDVSETGFNNVSESYGTDVVLSDLLSFDVQCFDPRAVVLPTADGNLTPSDPGWWNNDLWPSLNAAAVENLPHGAYVDLGYANGRWVTKSIASGGAGEDIQLPNSDTLLTQHPHRRLNHISLAPGGDIRPISVFSGLPAFRDSNNNGAYNSGEPFLGLSFLPAYGSVYCTWSNHYERDGLNQSSDNSLVDEGANGLDDNGLQGVDDAGERETSPPYPVAMRGLRVKIRVLEPGTRQIRQQTVTIDFTPN